MQVENIECQIAQAQIGNFLAGSGLSDEAMSQLEEHISQCSDCKAALADRRNELKAMLTQDRAVVDTNEIFRLSEEQSSATNIAAALRKKTLEQLAQPASAPTSRREAVAAVAAEALAAQPVAEPAKKPSYNWKPLGYSVALGSVLVAMSLFSSNFANIFGPRAIDAKSNDPKSIVAANPSSTKPTNAETKTAETKTSEPTAPANGETAKTDATHPVLVGNPAPTETKDSQPTTPTDKPTTDETSNPVTTDTETPAVLESLGATAGALATTQFASAEAPQTTTPPAETKPAPKTPTQIKPVVVPKKAAAKQAPRRVTSKRRAAKRVVRKSTRAAKPRHGITIYQP